MAISDYSATAGSNTSISGISLAENVMVPSDVNNAIRQLMADIKAGVDSVASFSGLLYGLTLSNNASDATNDIDIATGVCIDSANAAFMTLGSALTKRLDASWAVGTNQGMLATGAAITDTTYHIFLIKRPDTGVVDVAADTSVTGANIAANTNAAYTLKRRIGSIVRTSSAIKAFTQSGDMFFWQAPAHDVVTSSNPGTSASLITLTLPVGLSVVAMVHQSMIDISVSTTATFGLLSNPSAADTAPSTSAYDLFISGGSGTIGWSQNIRHVGTNTSAQIRRRFSNSTTDHFADMSTLGWIDSRGRAA